jgi:hypothetical protein
MAGKSLEQRESEFNKKFERHRDHCISGHFRQNKPTQTNTNTKLFWCIKKGFFLMYDTLTKSSGGQCITDKNKFFSLE